MADDEPRQTIDINYLKSSAFREVFTEGVIGGATPGGLLWLGFYSERYPLPRIIRHGIKPADNDQDVELDPGAPSVVIDGRSGILRNVEFGVSMSLETAKTLHAWLDEQIKNMMGEKK